MRISALTKNMWLRISDHVEIVSIWIVIPVVFFVFDRDHVLVPPVVYPYLNLYALLYLLLNIIFYRKSRIFPQKKEDGHDQ